MAGSILFPSILEGQLREISTYNINKMLPFAQAHILGLSSIPLSHPTSDLLSKILWLYLKNVSRKKENTVSSRKRNHKKVI